MEFTEFYNQINESTTRYSIEVNYRTTRKDVIDGYARLALGFTSAALKKKGLHVKKIFENTPIRIIVSNRNFEDGEWVVMVSYNDDLDCFVISKGFYNKSRETVTVQNNEKCEADSAAEIFKIVYNKITDVKEDKPHHFGNLKGIKGKTGPKRGSLRPAQGLLNKGKKIPRNN